jgi:DNA-binding XRE family transcriptional regulator
VGGGLLSAPGFLPRSLWEKTGKHDTPPELENHTSVCFPNALTLLPFRKHAPKVHRMPQITTRYGEWTQLRILRERSDIRQSDLASYIGISRSYYANLETGRKWPTPDITVRLARALHVPAVMIARTKKAA